MSCTQTMMARSARTAVLTCVASTVVARTLAGPSLAVSFAPNASAGLGNPWIGWVPYTYEAGQQMPAFPHSMENQYLAWNALLIGPGPEFDWSSLDLLLSAVALRGHSLIARVYADFPGGSPAFAVPAFLLPGLNICTYSENGGGQAPDYSNATLVEYMVATIRAMGARYDGDPRLAFIQVGFLGHWGEWHSETCPFAPVSTQAAVLSAFNSSFGVTKVVLRYPDVSGGVPVGEWNVGFHDDSFGQDTIGTDNWQFIPREVAANATEQWRVQPIGGELRPELQLCIMAEDPMTACAGQDVQPQNITQCITETHASWQWDYSAFKDGGYPAGNGDLGRALAAATLMGYSLSVDTLNITQTGSLYQVTWVLTNYGVAPPYYPINATLTVLDANGIHVQLLTPTIGFLQPGASLPLTGQIAIAWSSQGTALLGLALASSHALIPIAIATSGAAANGELLVTVSQP